MRKKFIILMILIIGAQLFLTGCTREDEIAGTVKIGVFEPETGMDSLGGNQEIMGIRYANSLTPTVEIGGATYKVDLVIADNQSDKEMGLTAAENLVKEGVSFILGSYGSQMTEETLRIFTEAGLPVLGITCTDSKLTEGDNNFFRICYTDVFQGKTLADYLWQQGLNKVLCIVQEGNSSSQSQTEAFAKAFQQLGGEVVQKQISKEKEAEDILSCLETAEEEKCEGIFSPISLQLAVTFLQQGTARNLSIPVFGGLNWDSHTIAAALEGKNIKVFVCSLYQPDYDPDFNQGLQEWIASDEMNLTANGGDSGLSAEAALGYDAYYTVLAAIASADSASPGQALKSLPEVTYSGVCGTIAFDGDGNASRDKLYIKRCDTAAGAWKLEEEWPN